MEWYSYSDLTHANKIFTITVTATAGCTFTESVQYTLTTFEPEPENCESAEIVINELPQDMHYLNYGTYTYGDNTGTIYNTQVSNVQTSSCGQYTYSLSPDDSWFTIINDDPSDSQIQFEIDTTGLGLSGGDYDFTLTIGLQDYPSISQTSSAFTVTLYELT